jgi:hypothetical protein
MQVDQVEPEVLKVHQAILELVTISIGLVVIVVVVQTITVLVDIK